MTAFHVNRSGAIDVKYILRQISISQALKKVPKIKYDCDGDEFLLDLLDQPSATQKSIVALNTAVDEPVGGGECEGGEHGQGQHAEDAHGESHRT